MSTRSSVSSGRCRSAEATALIDAGAQTLDTREPLRFEGGHLRDGLNVSLGGTYATWCGTLLDPERPIVLISEPGTETEAAVRLGRIGFDNVVGYLEGGMAQLDGAPELIERTERITAGNMHEQLAADNPPLIIDVRTPAEWSAAGIEGSVNVPLSRLTDELAGLERDRPTVVYCTSGYRSAIAASVLQRAGFTRVLDLVGGLPAWEAERLQPA